MGPLNAQIIVFVDLVTELPFTADSQGIVLHSDVNVLLLYLRQISLHHQLVLGFVDIDCRSPACQLRLAGSASSEAILEQAVHLFVKRIQTAKGFPASHRAVHFRSLHSNYIMTACGAYNMSVHMSSIFSIGRVAKQSVTVTMS